MAVPNIFDVCLPRDDVRDGKVSDADLAADLAAVITGKAVPDYSDPVRFFANTYQTRGLRNLLEAVCRRLSGAAADSDLQPSSKIRSKKPPAVMPLKRAPGSTSGPLRSGTSRNRRSTTL